LMQYHKVFPAGHSRICQETQMSWNEAKTEQHII